MYNATTSGDASKNMAGSSTFIQTLFFMLVTVLSMHIIHPCTNDFLFIRISLCCTTRPSAKISSTTTLRKNRSSSGETMRFEQKPLESEVNDVE